MYVIILVHVFQGTNCTLLLTNIETSHVKNVCRFPKSFASNIEDEVRVGNTAFTETPHVYTSKEASTCPGQVKDVLSEHTNNIQKMLDNFQSNTVHSLEISLVSAIEKLSSVQSARSNNDQQSQISKLLQDKDNLMREKDNLLKQRRNGPQDENQHSAMKPELQALTRQLEKCNQEKDGLQEWLHNSVTEYQIQKSKLDEIRNYSIFFSGFLCQFIQGSLKRIDYPKQLSWPTLLLLNVSTALKGTHNYIFI